MQSVLPLHSVPCVQEELHVGPASCGPASTGPPLELELPPLELAPTPETSLARQRPPSQYIPPGHSLPLGPHRNAPDEKTESGQPADSVAASIPAAAKRRRLTM